MCGREFNAKYNVYKCKEQSSFASFVISFLFVHVYSLCFCRLCLHAAASEIRLKNFGFILNFACWWGLLLCAVFIRSIWNTWTYRYVWCNREAASHDT